ncbi:MAG: hypothetical protein AB1566_08360 [Chloroflexota bacterium]
MLTFSQRDVVQTNHHFEVIFLDTFMAGCPILIGGQAFISIGQLLGEKGEVEFAGHGAVQRLIRRDLLQPDRAIAKTLIARAIENEDVRPSRYFHDMICKEIMDVLK